MRTVRIFLNGHVDEVECSSCAFDPIVGMVACRDRHGALVAQYVRSQVLGRRSITEAAPLKMREPGA